MSASPSRRYRPETRLVHSGSLRSQFGETSEALFLTQGYVYENSLQAERRFKNEEPGYQYSRFSNPTVTMFEQRMAALEGAEAARATATGMAAVTTAMMGQLRAGDHVVASKALFGSCRYVVEEHCNRYGIASTLVDGTDLAQWKNAVRPAPRWWSTTYSRLRCISARSSAAPIVLSTRRPSTAMARAAASAASSSA